ncbi:hypothetical protein [Rhizohabitans arisaemae]|uniref:hypothetical protein n=1 Tax=Rhizohabitans arisaemae TaxID=2720610 RepID=UPI0024B267C4|nr:hypothetical protein [Rhizohabitans arisaemae]
MQLKVYSYARLSQNFEDEIESVDRHGVPDPGGLSAIGLLTKLATGGIVSLVNAAPTLRQGLRLTQEISAVRAPGEVWLFAAG